MKTISLITIFYGKENINKYFLPYLNAVKSLKVKNLNVYILDNSPKPHLKQFVRENNIKLAKKFKIIEDSSKKGFAVANNFLANLAKKESNPKYLLFLNPDTELSVNAVDEMIKVLKSEENIFSVDAKQYPFEHPKWYDPKTLDTSWCSGACMLVNKRIFEKLGGFRESFFMYAEDVDISWRAWEKGYKCKYAPKAICVHHTYGLNKNPLFRQYWNVRNGVAMRIIHGSQADIRKYLLYILSALFFSIKHLYFKEVVNLIKATSSGLYLGIKEKKSNKLEKNKRPKFAQFFEGEYAKHIK